MSFVYGCCVADTKVLSLCASSKYSSIVRMVSVFHRTVWWTDAPYNREVPSWMALIRAVMLCNKAEFRSGQENLPILKRSVLVNLLWPMLFQWCLDDAIWMLLNQH